MYYDNYPQMLFMFQLKPDHTTAVPLFIYEYNLAPTDPFDVVVISGDELVLKFKKYLEKVNLDINFTKKRVMFAFGKYGVNKFKQKRANFYSINPRHLLEEL